MNFSLKHLLSFYYHILYDFMLIDKKEMKPKHWKLRLKAIGDGLDDSGDGLDASDDGDGLDDSSTSNTSIVERKDVRHLSLFHEKEKQKKKDAKTREMQEIIKYCEENNCKGYTAVKKMNLVHWKDPRTINTHLEKKIVTGEEWAGQRILTKQEEKSLSKYLVNKNRCCQGLNESQAAGVVLNILRVRQKLNRVKRGRDSIPLSVNATNALRKKKVNRSFFRRFRAEHPEVKPKAQHKVSLKRGLRCTREMAIDYLDSVAKVLIENKIAPDLKQIRPGVWRGAIDVSKIWAHDETPQMINFNATGQSKKKVYAGKGHDCSKLSKENRESVTVHPFSNFAGELALVQVIFAGSGMTSHMCPPSAAEKIPNLLVSVNESGCSTGKTLHDAYKELGAVIKEKGESDAMDVVLADGHKSRFEPNVMRHCEKINLDQFILWPDTSGCTQKHDQINSQLHSIYEEKKSDMYTEYAELNKECFMNILSEVVTEWATPERLIKAGKRVGISSEGLNIDWMDQAQFERAEAVLNTPTKAVDAPIIKSPEGVRKDSALYWKSKYMQAVTRESITEQVDYQLENIEGVFPFRKVKPSKTNRKKITDVHGSLKGTEIRKLVEKKEQEDKQKEENRKTKVLEKNRLKEIFIRCKETCQCSGSSTSKNPLCEARQLQQCSICQDVLKSKCGKKGCKVDGLAPLMIVVAARKKQMKRKSISSDEESDEEGDYEEEEVQTWDTSDEDESFEGFEDENTENEIEVIRKPIETSHDSILFVTIKGRGIYFGFK